MKLIKQEASEAMKTTVELDKCWSIRAAAGTRNGHLLGLVADPDVLAKPEVDASKIVAWLEMAVPAATYKAVRAEIVGQRIASQNFDRVLPIPPV